MRHPENRGGQRHGSKYFYLSYAHSPPLSGSQHSDPDQWVHSFFEDLTASVTRIASPGSGVDPGFFDQDVTPGSDWKATITQALGSAQVFVPLYSPSYFARSLPGREWACFQQRLIRVGIEDPVSRFAPVLWIPLPGERDRPGLREALAIGPAEEAYSENGLRALLRLRPYRTVYQTVVDRVAEQVVRLAERDPVAPSAVPDIDEVQSAFDAEAAAAVFTVAVAAPVSSALAADHDLASYSQTGPSWKPFSPSREISLAAYATRVAEQLDFAVVQTDIEKAGELFGDRPGVILIDPWFIAEERGLRILQSSVRDLPAWVLALLVLDPQPDARAAELADSTRSILQKAGVARSEAARRAIRGVTSVTEFTALMPILVTEAERQYLRHGPVLRATARPGSRPRLIGGGRGVGSAILPRAAEEEPNA
jgi:FxsC-like protein